MNVIVQDFIGSVPAAVLHKVAVPGALCGVGIARKGSNSQASRSCAA
jgi:hypothetical protein